MTSALENYINRTVAVITSDGRMIVGTLKGFDQTINLILDESHERVFSSSQGVEQVVLGLYIVRGDNVHSSVVKGAYWKLAVSMHRQSGELSMFQKQVKIAKGRTIEVGGIGDIFMPEAATTKQASEVADFLSLFYISENEICAVIGEIDEETDSALDLGNIRAEPLNSVVH